MHSNTIKDENKEIAACAQILKASTPLLLAQALQVDELKQTPTMLAPTSKE